MTYEIDVERRLVTSIASGLLTVADVEKHRAALLQDSRFRPDFNQIADFLAVTKVAIASDNVQLLAARKLFSNNSRRAAVVTSPEVFGLLRMFATYHELSGNHEEVELFDNREDAMRWLSQP